MCNAPALKKSIQSEMQKGNAKAQANANHKKQLQQKQEQRQTVIRHNKQQ